MFHRAGESTELVYSANLNRIWVKQKTTTLKLLDYLLFSFLPCVSVARDHLGICLYIGTHTQLPVGTTAQGNVES